MSITQLIDNNIDTLQSAVKLLETLSADRYTFIEAPCFESSLGKHLRHIVDHYLCFQRDFEVGVIDYDKRLRDTQLETDKDYAVEVIVALQNFFKGVKRKLEVESDQDRPLNVLMCNDVNLPSGQITRSSLGRELQFLQGHSVHHFALMAAMVRLGGQNTEQGFGVAPSTLVHEQHSMKESA